MVSHTKNKLKKLKCILYPFQPTSKTNRPMVNIIDEYAKQVPTNDTLYALLQSLHHLSTADHDNLFKLLDKLLTSKFQFNMKTTLEIMRVFVELTTYNKRLSHVKDRFVKLIESVVDTLVINSEDDILVDLGNIRTMQSYTYMTNLGNLLKSNKFKILFTNEKVTKFLISAAEVMNTAEVDNHRYRFSQYSFDIKQDTYTELLKQFIAYGYRPDQKLLDALLGYSVREPEVFMILDVVPIPLTSEQFEIVINREITVRNRNYMIAIKKGVAAFIDRLVERGLKVDHGMIVKAAKKGYYLNDIGRFPVDKESLKIACTDVPEYGEFLGLDKDLIKLRELCSRPNTIKSIIKMINGGVKPDIHCLENATKGDTNYHKRLIEYLIDHGGLKANDVCLRNIAEHNPIAKRLVESYLAK